MGHGALSFLAGLGSGYMQGAVRKQDLERQEKMDKIKLDEAAAAQEERDRMKALRAQLAADPNAAGAGAPNTASQMPTPTGSLDAMKPAPAADPSTSATADTPPTTPTTAPSTDMSGGMVAGASTPPPTLPAQVDPSTAGVAPGAVAAPGATPVPVPTDASAVAPAMASPAGPAARVGGVMAPTTAAPETPQARAERMALIYDKNGDPVTAARIRNEAQQQELGALQLTQAHRTALKQKFDDDMERQVHTFDDLATFITKSRGDGQGGGLQMVAQPSADGKTVALMGINPDGSLRDTGQHFENSAGGLTMAKASLSQMVSSEGKLVHLHQQAQEDIARKQLTQQADLARASIISHEKTTEATNRTQVQVANIHAAATLATANKPPPGYMWGPVDPKTGQLTQVATKGGPADVKVAQAFNKDASVLNNSFTGLDRLAVAANEVLNHPGLKGNTGLRGMLPNTPGSPAADAWALLNTLKSQVAFSVLQEMRNNSKSGGALGSVSNADMALLQSNLAALDKAQSYEAIKEQLVKIIDFTAQSKDRMATSFNRQYGDRAETAMPTPTEPGKPGGAPSPKPAAPSPKPSGTAAPQSMHKAAGTPAAPAAPAAPRVTSEAEYAALPVGASYLDPSGNTRTKGSK